MLRAAVHRAAGWVHSRTSPRPARSGQGQRYHAASQGRLTGNWNPAGQNANRLIAWASPSLRARVRDLVRNFPPFARAVDGVTAFVVGRGARFQSLAVDSTGKPDRRLRQKIESRFRAWMDEADVARKLHFYEMQQLAVRQEMESGEYLFRFVTPKNRKRLPFALQAHEAESFADQYTASTSPDTDIFQGVEYDVLTGEPLGYHLQYSPQQALAPTLPWRPWREPAENVLHGFHMLRPGQLRGITPFAPAILCAKDMADYTDAEIDAAKMAAKWLAFVESPYPDQMQMMGGGMGRLGGQAGQGGPARGEEPDKIEWIENAAIEYLRTGEKMSFAPSSGRPGDSFDRFGRFTLRMVSIIAPLPYEILSGDYTDINYTTSKASRNDFSQILAPRKFRLQQHFSQRVFHRWLDFEAVTQDYLPGYFADPARYRRAMWIPAGLPSVDPLRDGKADIDAINAKLKSPQQVILARGDDPEEVLDQCASWIRDCIERGLDPSLAGINTALANNPAKLGAPEEFEG